MYVLVIVFACAVISGAISKKRDRGWLSSSIIGLIFGPLGVVFALLLERWYTVDINGTTYHGSRKFLDRAYAYEHPESSPSLDYYPGKQL